MQTVLGTCKLRPAVHGDAEAVTELIIATDIETFGKPDFSLGDLLEIWEKLSLATNTWVVLGADGALHGYGSVEEMGEGRLDTYIYVNPASKGLGIGSLLLDKAEARACEYVADYQRKGIEYEFNNIVAGRNGLAFELLESRGYAVRRLHARMEIKLTESPALPEAPAGVTVRPFEQGRDERAFYEAHRQSFQDSRGFHEKPFAEWLEGKTGEQYDPRLWFLATVDGDEESAGFIIVKHLPDCVWVDLLGVTRGARKRGIGEYLLKKVFYESWQQGRDTIALTVDLGSLTNASRLYERAGMQADYELFMYGKEL
ncbi:hypothetical protein CBW65_14810 [Tumebacillus avium]|uniref:N-acetyltransferase domain-containing protein n=1 Tax=Tumebacillus avium TaxID=1903704 RepID=A0A1Y0IQK9_9BACL|nr:GNAT family N-acetyltransferase [Tumebacillus avium]ARU62126.1 hypothetical protein CBW65_14810 [Tumebacillus avium]